MKINDDQFCHQSGNGRSKDGNDTQPVVNVSELTDLVAEEAASTPQSEDRHPASASCRFAQSAVTSLKSSELKQVDEEAHGEGDSETS